MEAGCSLIGSRSCTMLWRGGVVRSYWLPILHQQPGRCLLEVGGGCSRKSMLSSCEVSRLVLCRCFYRMKTVKYPS